MRTRRGVLTAVLTSVVAGITGCSTTSQERPTEANTDPEPQQTTESDQPNTQDRDQTTEDTEPETFTLPRTGTLSFKTRDGSIGPDGFFDQGDITLETRVVRENGEEEFLTTQELREKEHFNKIQEIAENNYTGWQRELLKDFPHNLTDKDWLMENIYQRIADDSDAVDQEYLEQFEIPFTPEEYTGGGNLDERFTDSKWQNLWGVLILEADDVMSSTNDWIKAAMLAATEYHAANRTTVTFDDKTLSGVHGLVFAITEPTYDGNKLNQQETWGVETDPREDDLVWPLDETHGYPNDGGRIAFETPEPDADPLRIGLTKWEDIRDGNMAIESHVDGKFEDFIRDPSSQKGMKYLDAMCLASYIEDQARTEGGWVEEDGAVPELEGAEIHVYDDRIEYVLDEEVEITRESNLSTPEMDSNNNTETTAAD
jgi:predicted component of type VI protein secretion system